MKNAIAASKEIKGWDFQGERILLCPAPPVSFLQLNLKGEKGVQTNKKPQQTKEQKKTPKQTKEPNNTLSE